MTNYIKVAISGTDCGILEEIRKLRDVQRAGNTSEKLIALPNNAQEGSWGELLALGKAEITLKKVKD